MSDLRGSEIERIISKANRLDTFCSIFEPSGNAAVPDRSGADKTDLVLALDDDMRSRLGQSALACNLVDGTRTGDVTGAALMPGSSENPANIGCPRVGGPPQRVYYNIIVLSFVTNAVLEFLISMQVHTMNLHIQNTNTSYIRLQLHTLLTINSKRIIRDRIAEGNFSSDAGAPFMPPPGPSLSARVRTT